MFEKLAHYKILDRIGAGELGEVYRARDTRLGRTVAIKVIGEAVAGDPERRARFIEQARAAALLSHPNIAALYEIGEDADALFLACEFVPGDTLKATIGGHPMNVRRAIDLGAQLADALAQAHAAGVVHRDISATNVIVTPKGNAKILDFGLGTPGMTLGAVAYLSPELAVGEPVDHRTDIFSLGVVLFEMLTGALPFTARTETALAARIAQAPAPVPSSINGSLPRDLDAIVARALTKSLDRRYQSAAVLAADLRSAATSLASRSDASVPPAVVLEGQRRIPTWAGLVVLAAFGAAAAWASRSC